MTAVFFVFLVLPAALIAWATWGNLKPGRYTGEVLRFDSPERTPASDTSSIRLMTWNIAYGHGVGSAAERNYERKPFETSKKRLSEIAQVIRREKADIVLLQEIDNQSNRSHGFDQLMRIGEESGLQYAARAVSWKANYIPYPTWPINKQYGYMNSGGAVLSRYPITKNEYWIHDKPKGNHFVKNLFFIGRFSQLVCVKPNDKEFCFLNNHLEAFEVENRILQAGAVSSFVEDSESKIELVAFAGDFNTVPREAKKKAQFVDEPRDDYSKDPSMTILQSIKGYRELVSSDEYQADESKYFTFPSDTPNRRLDYVFVNDQWQVKDKKVLKTGDLSDHLPIVATLAR